MSVSISSSKTKNCFIIAEKLSQVIYNGENRYFNYVCVISITICSRNIFVNQKEINSS